MSKIAVIDIGSNSVRMVIFDAMARAPHYIFNEKALCRLGEGLGETGHLSPQGVSSAKSELERFVFIARYMQVSSLEIVATAAVREATDGAQFCQWVEEKLGQNVRVLSGLEEAQFAAQGVLLGWPEAHGIISDMGGSSMELINVHNGVPETGHSTRLGPLSLANLSGEKRKKRIKSELEAAIQAVKAERKEALYLVGGSWRAFARADMVRRKYPFQILHEYKMHPEDIEATNSYIKKKGIQWLHQTTGTSMQRLELLPTAALVLRQMVKFLQPQTINISSYGLREGLLYDNMPSWMRASDPLIAAAEAMEKETARVPGFGQKLYHWLAPLRQGLSTEEDRIVLAACHLHDTNWRFHPDFRAKLGYEIVAQANICGVTHEERVFLALALAARYENKPEYADTHPATALLNETQKEAAWALGRAMRLGAMLSGSVQELLDHMPLSLNHETLTLRIDSQYRAFYGESVEKRLESLGKVMDQAVEIEFT